MYLEGLIRFTESGGLPDSYQNQAENASQGGSNNGRENGSGSGSGIASSNMAFLDSTAGHRNLSGSNGGSGNGSSNSIQYVPILIVCCPNLLKNETCSCGHTSSVQIPANTLPVNQFVNLLTNPTFMGNSSGSSGSHNLISKLHCFLLHN